MSDLTPEALDRLAQLDADATPGPWTWIEKHGRDFTDEAWSYVAVTEDDERAAKADAVAATAWPGGPETDNALADAALIAAMRNHLPALLDAARERDRLARWKAEALPVMAGVQELGRALGVDLGEIITARESVDLALDLRNERDAARAEVAALRERVEALADSIHGDAGWEHDGGCEGEPDCLACIEAELRAALADPATAKEADE